ncbi:serine hydrolase FSH [Aspergillus heterothallicus]
MHFLCLHGTGTSSKILEMQTAAFRYELGDGHTYDFVQGLFHEPLGAEFQEIFPTEKDGFSYFNLDPAAASLQPVQDLEDFMAAEGPYDGVIAFSQGIIVASTIIFRSVQEGRPSPFKCAIFFSPRLGAMDYGEFQRSGKVGEIDFDAHQGVIPVPTALIWGREDPDRGKAAQLQKLYPQGRLFSYVHSGGHAVPGAGQTVDLLKSVNVARRAIEMAMEGC